MPTVVPGCESAALSTPRARAHILGKASREGLMSVPKYLAVCFAALVFAAAGSARADVKIGVVLALTGPNASLGVPYRKGLELIAKEIAGEKVQLIVLDDASDPSTAVRDAQKLIQEDKIDLLIGGSHRSEERRVGEEGRFRW